ncbi:MAG: hypothetical protein ACTSSP_00270 [Candidatus Asgardarchaeia archaeon]
MQEWIKFVCQNCEQGVKTPVENAGKKGRCHQCKTECIIPERETEEEREEAFISDLFKDLDEIDKQAEIESNSLAKILKNQEAMSGSMDLDDPI